MCVARRCCTETARADCARAQGIVPTVIVVVVNAQRGFDSGPYTTRTSTARTDSALPGARSGMVFAADPHKRSAGGDSEPGEKYPTLRLPDASADYTESISLTNVSNRGDGAV